MGCMIERHKTMALAEKEGDEDEVMIDKDNSVGTEENNNDNADELNDSLKLNHINDSMAQEEEQVEETHDNSAGGKKETIICKIQGILNKSTIVIKITIIMITMVLTIMIMMMIIIVNHNHKNYNLIEDMH